MRITCGVLLLGILVAPLAGQPAPKPTKGDIARWIQELGSDDFNVREEATRKLWEAGTLAEEAINKAAKSDDAEVSRRAREVADKFRLGIYPDTPQAVVEALGRFQAGDPNTKVEVVRDLLNQGAAGCRAIIRLAKQDLGAQVKPQILGLLSNELSRSIPDLLASKNHALLEELLEITLDDPSNGTSQQNYVAYWLLVGKLDERIAHHQAALAKKDRERRHEELLARLYRAKGSYREAAALADKAGDEGLATNLLYEAGAWKELAARGDKVRQGDEIESLGHRAAYARLAGDTRTCDALILELKKQGETRDPHDDRLFQVAKCLFLNDQPDLALAVLERGDYWVERFQILIGRMRHKEAFALVEKAREQKIAALPKLELLEARTLHALGVKDRALKTFDRYAAQIKPANDLSWLEDLIDAEARAGLRDRALEHTAKILTVSNDQGWASRLFGKLFPKKSKLAEPLWLYFRERFRGQDSLVLLRQLRDLLDGKTTGEALRAIAKGAEGTVKDLVPPQRAACLEALAEVLRQAGERNVALDLLTPFKTPKALLLQGDILFSSKQFTEAAAKYQAAFELNRQNPMPLYLLGLALEKAGKVAEGQARTEQAHWLPLGQDDIRDDFVRELARRGHAKALAREVDLLRRTSQPGEYYAGEAIRRQALIALAAKDYATSATGHELAMLRCLRSYINFIEKGAYVGVPAMVHSQRAAGLVQAGKFDEAREEFARALTISPSSVEGTMRMVQVLDRAGRKKEADECFEKGSAVYRTLIGEYPDCAWAHNSAAWLAATCRRGLEQAKKDAEKAVALEPESSGYLDTLAEVHFQLGDQARAVAVQKKVVALAPKRVYFKKQLARLEAGDRKADLPPEDDDEEDDDD